ncbi:MAG: hypothetical protein KGJ23_10080 [Euryarchaeota archaeon]|nr:hypothetical protein [Euryarchaeota archaeon]MDE1836952.1 hypothetical protein [Euryarchaeota archaeon]MDE2045863.1 hypothetical protein [Thermoplasmata archaeon]
MPFWERKRSPASSRPATPRALKPPVQRQLADASRDDVGFGRVRLGPATRRALGVAPLEYVEVIGRRATVAIVHERQGTRVDEATAVTERAIQRNAGAKVGEIVQLRKVEPLAAERITIAPIYSGAPRMDLGPGLESFVAKALSRRPFAPGDIFVVPGVFLMGGSLLFRVMGTAPLGSVVIGPNSLVTIMNEAVPEMVVGTVLQTNPRDPNSPPELVDAQGMATELELSLRAYRLLAHFGESSTRNAALAWLSSAEARLRPIRARMAIEAEWHEADERWERDHPKPPHEPEFDRAWLAREAAGRVWTQSHRSPKTSPDHLRGRRAALQAMETWALMNPAPKIGEDLYDEEVAARAGRAMVAAVRFTLEDQPWLEEALQWRETHPEPPLPPEGSAAPCLEWHLAFHAWQDAHPHPHESTDERADRLERQASCEALWRRLAAKYP